MSALEHEIQRDVIELYERVGCVVIRLAQPHRLGSGTRQTRGIPDLYVFPPLRRGDELDAPFWHEVKKPDGKQRPEQKTFETHCVARRVAYVLGGTTEAIAQLRRIRLIRRENQ